MQSLDIPTGPRNPNGYTADEILRALRGMDGSRELSFRYELLDGSMNKIRDLDEVITGQVNQNFLAVVKRTANFTLKDRGGDSINFLTDQVKPFCRVKMPARWKAEHLRYDQSFYNNCNGASGTPVTSDNSANNGSPFTLVDNGGVPEDVMYDSAIRVSGSSVKMTRSGATTPFVSTGRAVFEGGKRGRLYFYISSGAAFQARPIDPLDGTVFSASAAGLVIDEPGGIFEVHGGAGDLSADLANVVDTWVRFEMEYLPDEDKVQYRFFWTDPRGHGDPDAVYENTISSLGNPGFGGYRLYCFGGTVWTDDISVGTVTLVPARLNPTDDDFVEFSLGVFLLSSPTRESDADGVVTRVVEGYDRSKIFIDDKLDDRFTVLKGQKYIDVISNLLGDIPKKITPIDTVCGRDREWPPGTEVENVINDITQSINYESLTFDEDGYAIIRPYILPDERTAEYTYADDEVSVMQPEVSNEFDLFEVANKWVVYVSNPDLEPLRVVIKNEDASNPTSIPRRGRVITDFREDLEATDYHTLMSRVRRVAFEASRQFDIVEFSTAIMPFHSFNDVYNIQYGPLVINDKYTEHEWEMPLEAGAEMTHRARRVVRLSPESDDAFIDDDLTITGAVEADNIAVGANNIDTTDGIPTSVLVTGLSLTGSGRVYVQATARTSAATNPQIREVTVTEEAPTRFRLWIYRSAGSGNLPVNWIAMRSI